MINKKHAYLLIVHNNSYTLEKLIKLLDDERNDIYIHIDKKSKEIDIEKIKQIATKSKILVSKEIKVYWGDFSQVECEILLLEKAIKGKYMYYHLLSGSDLPIKTQDYIHNFFDKNKGKEFIHFEREVISENKKEWINKYHILQKYISMSKNKFINKFIQCIEKVILKMQDLIKINRYNNSTYTLQSGANWFSITHELAEYILQQKEWINDTFRLTRSADELFLQTIVTNSKFINNLYNREFDNNYEACMRYIDWKRGTPYVFKIKDFEELTNSKCLWARKFEYKVDKEIIDKIYNYILNKEKEE